jgi:hypothetical protein
MVTVTVTAPPKPWASALAVPLPVFPVVAQPNTPRETAPATSAVTNNPAPIRKTFVFIFIQFPLELKNLHLIFT